MSERKMLQDKKKKDILETTLLYPNVLDANPLSKVTLTLES